MSFRREKYVPKGGPDGGDGGNGGDVLFAVEENLRSLSHLAVKKIYKAKDGDPGTKRKKHGRAGESVRITVPPGTIIKDAETGDVLKDLAGVESWLFLKGGKGGRGNTHFKSSTRQSPRYAQQGLPGDSARVALELNIIADVGIVGKPNAGKSTLLSVLTSAQPKIGSYPFTTKTPNLGVMRESYQEVVLADIPGLIEGAADGAGLGIKFLKHVSRTKALLILLDLTLPNVFADFTQVIKELAQFDEHLAGKRRLIVGNKLEDDITLEHLSALTDCLKDEEILGVSAITLQGLPSLRKKILELSRTP